MNNHSIRFISCAFCVLALLPGLSACAPATSTPAEPTVTASLPPTLTRTLPPPTATPLPSKTPIPPTPTLQPTETMPSDTYLVYSPIPRHISRSEVYINEYYAYSVESGKSWLLATEENSGWRR